MPSYAYNSVQTKPSRRSLRIDSTSQERKVWGFLKNKQICGTRFLRQYSVGAYILDFFCPQLRLAIEIDGGQHNEAIKKDKDQERTKFLASRNITVLRFWNNDVDNSLEGVYDKINEVVAKLSSNPSYSPLGTRGERVK